MRLPSETELRLLALTSAERSGREIARLFSDTTGKRLSYGTLYTSLRRLRERGWVTIRDGEDQDGRVRWFCITGEGAEAAEAAREHHRSLAEFGLGLEAQ